jgi:hypothetical protein
LAAAAEEDADAVAPPNLEDALDTLPPKREAAELTLPAPPAALPAAERADAEAVVPPHLDVDPEPVSVRTVPADADTTVFLTGAPGFSHWATPARWWARRDEDGGGTK